ncbi:hypothetical protein AQPE_1970 [Aquipluma nitroreducens]|uniref:Uncharacterized protein n=1 Tax=Aquipluma nitroreducens TaxID=2010828 RepID=A0A5K7S8D1_9BACT|nr:hypothetical protein [Aquipluma nitroreducens]BBE17813.1 hypothetical protein AQPE_1970 [Aquipluma nitroreducens]
MLTLQFTPEQIKNLGQIAAYSVNKVNENFSKAFAELKSAIKPIDEKINQLKSQQSVVIRNEHVFTIDFRNSRAALTMISMALVILLSLGCHKWQFDRNWQLKDNDLKYRYIKSINGISSENLNKLERIFKYPRDKKKIEEIREKVEGYENKFKD